MSERKGEMGLACGVFLVALAGMLLTACESKQEPAPEPKAAVTRKAPTAEPDPRRLTRAFGRRHARVETCFARHAKALEGRPELSIRFKVSTSGRVADANLQPAALAGTALGRCLL